MVVFFTCMHIWTAFEIKTFIMRIKSLLLKT